MIWGGVDNLFKILCMFCLSVFKIRLVRCIVELFYFYYYDIEREKRKGIVLEKNFLFLSIWEIIV